MKKCRFFDSAVRKLEKNCYKMITYKSLLAPDLIILNSGKCNYLIIYNDISCHFIELNVNPLSTIPTKRSNTLKQFVGNLPTNCLNVFDHFVILALKELFSAPTLKLECEEEWPWYVSGKKFCSSIVSERPHQNIWLKLLYSG